MQYTAEPKELEENVTPSFWEDNYGILEGNDKPPLELQQKKLFGNILQMHLVPLCNRRETLSSMALVLCNCTQRLLQGDKQECLDPPFLYKDNEVLV